MKNKSVIPSGPKRHKWTFRQWMQLVDLLVRYSAGLFLIGTGVLMVFKNIEANGSIEFHFADIMSGKYQSGSAGILFTLLGMVVIRKPEKGGIKFDFHIRKK